jgi:hypothetical protein
MNSFDFYKKTKESSNKNEDNNNKNEDNKWEFYNKKYQDNIRRK